MPLRKAVFFQRRELELKEYLLKMIFEENVISVIICFKIHFSFYDNV